MTLAASVNGSQLLQPSTAYNRTFYMGVTALTLTATLSKNGGAFAAAGGTITQLSGGWYYIALTTTDTNTPGSLAYIITDGLTNIENICDQVAAPVLIGANMAHGDTGGANTSFALANDSDSVAAFSVTNANATGQAALFSGGAGDYFAVLGDGISQSGASFYASGDGSSARLKLSTISGDNSAASAVYGYGYNYVGLSEALGRFSLGLADYGGAAGATFKGNDFASQEQSGASLGQVTLTDYWGPTGIPASAGGMFFHSPDSMTVDYLATFADPTNFAALACIGSGTAGNGVIAVGSDGSRITFGAGNDTAAMSAFSGSGIYAFELCSDDFEAAAAFSAFTSSQLGLLVFGNAD